MSYSLQRGCGFVLVGGWGRSCRSYRFPLELGFMQASSQDTPALELALLHRSLGEITASTEHCGRCGRALLIGERVYEYEDGGLACSLCRDRERRTPALTRTVHTAASGHSIRVLDRRARRRTL